MRTCRDPYPFHRSPCYTAEGIRPVPLAPKPTPWGILGRLVLACGAISVATTTILGFFAP